MSFEGSAEKLFLAVYRSATAGLLEGDASSAQFGWRALSLAMSVDDAALLYGDFCGFAGTIASGAKRPSACLATNGEEACKDEALAMNIINRAQCGDLEAAQRATALLVRAENVGAVLQSAQHLAASLGRCGLFVSALSDEFLTSDQAGDAAGVEGNETPSVFAKLLSAQIQPTRQRLAVGALIFRSDDRHFTAEMVYAESRAVPRPPTLSTIYYTLDHFVARGILRKVAVYDSTSWYDTSMRPHRHFFNVETNELVDIVGRCDVFIDASPPTGSEIDMIDVVVRLRSK